ncbi:MAG TPA: hypothetical protein VF581_05535 [Flavobacterium sp.]|jgi:hypothetical protein
MKNKRSIYILLPAVLLIWGSVLYQFFSLSDGGSTQLQISNDFDDEPHAELKKDTFSINVNYRDPFLGTIPKSYVPPAKPRKVVKDKAESLLWPTIIYKGTVSDNKEKSQVFLLIINGRTCLMKKGSVEDDVLLKRGDRRQVEVIYQKTLATIPLQE